MWGLSQEEIWFINIHNKLLFDSLSEALSEYQKEVPKPGIGLSNLVRRFEGQGIDSQFYDILAKARRKVEHWAKLQCGSVFKESSLEMFAEPVPDSYWQSQEEQLNQLRETRLNASLKNELEESHTQWLDIRRETQHIVEDVSELVFDHVLHEFLNEIF